MPSWGRCATRYTCTVNLWANISCILDWLHWIVTGLLELKVPLLLVQVLQCQCLMSNPADLHPAAVAEDQNLYWPIIWYWGFVHAALRPRHRGVGLRQAGSRRHLHQARKAYGVRLSVC